MIVITLIVNAGSSARPSLKNATRPASELRQIRNSVTERSRTASAERLKRFSLMAVGLLPWVVRRHWQPRGLARPRAANGHRVRRSDRLVQADRRRVRRRRPGAEPLPAARKPLQARRG